LPGRKAAFVLEAIESGQMEGHPRTARSTPDLCYPKSVVRMIWWFLILAVSSLVVVCVAIALYMRLRHHLQAARAPREGSSSEAERERQSGEGEH
jgi:hypothetical protein